MEIGGGPQPLVYINHSLTTHVTYLNIENPLPKASWQQAAVLRQSAAKAFPFLEYAVQNILYHADAAEREGVKQKGFLQMFPLIDWINMNNLFERDEIRQYTPNASLLYILAERNMPNLIKAHPSNLSCFKIEDERYGMPIIAALATGSEETVRAILKIQAEVHPPTSSLHNMCQQYYQDGSKLPKFMRDFNFSRKRVLHSAVEHGDVKLLTFLLAIGLFEVNLKDSIGRTALYFAAEGGHEVVVKLLLATGQVDFDVKNKKGGTPLLYAAQNGHEGVVKLLLATGQVEVNAKDKDGWTPLYWACNYGHEAVVKLLLATSRVEVDTKNSDGRTPLFCAVQNRHEAIVKLLLATDQVDVDAKNSDDRTLLICAAQNGLEAIVKLLLAIGQVEVDAKDKAGRTPLWWACNYGHEAVVKLLLATSRVEADVKDRWDKTLLLCTARNRHEAVVKLLLATGQVEVDADNSRKL